MERIVFKHIHNHLIDNDLIYKKQSGFLPGHCTVFQLIDIYHQICYASDNKESTCMIFCDISKAFDRVWHKGLLYKLRQNGINGTLLHWLDSYLSNRNQTVLIGNSISLVKKTNAGVPQGSVLGPLLFLIYVNDIADNLVSVARLYADDSSLAASTNDIDEMEILLNTDMNTISEWAKQWLVTFNPNKTEAIIFSNRFSRLPNIKFDGVNVKFVKHHKHLGVTLSEDCKWHEHINQVIKSASKVLNSMRLIKFKVSRKTLNSIYISYMRPILEYASVVWDGCTVYEQENLEKMQYEAARIITGLTRSVSINKLIKEIGWISLSDRRKMQKLSIVHRAKLGLLPCYLQDIFPNNVSTISHYNLRNSDNFITVPRRTELFNKSFIPSSVDMYNQLDVNIKSSATISSFKTHMREKFKCPSVPNHFIVGNRFYSVIHARLRNGCSALNFDLHRNHLSEVTFCQCGSPVEDAEHYFFKCPKYVNERITLFRATRQFHPLSTSALLIGKQSLSQRENDILFQHVQSFLKQTRRFI